MIVISLVNDFSSQPGGRDKDKGPFSGESFREDVLEPALAENDQITVDLNGADAIAPSFLDESLGQLMEDLGRKKYEERILVLLNDDPDALDVLEEIKSRRFN